MNEITHEFVADITDRSLGVKLIVTGLARLVEEEDIRHMTHYVSLIIQDTIVFMHW